MGRTDHPAPNADLLRERSFLTGGDNHQPSLDRLSRPQGDELGCWAGLYRHDPADDKNHPRGSLRARPIDHRLIGQPVVDGVYPADDPPTAGADRMRFRGNARDDAVQHAQTSHCLDLRSDQLFGAKAGRAFGVTVHHGHLPALAGKNGRRDGAAQPGADNQNIQQSDSLTWGAVAFNRIGRRDQEGADAFARAA